MPKSQVPGLLLSMAVIPSHPQCCSTFLQQPSGHHVPLEPSSSSTIARPPFLLLIATLDPWLASGMCGTGHHFFLFPTVPPPWSSLCLCLHAECSRILDIVVHPLHTHIGTHYPPSIPAQMHRGKHRRHTGCCGLWSSPPQGQPAAQKVWSYVQRSGFLQQTVACSHSHSAQ